MSVTPRYQSGKGLGASRGLRYPLFEPRVSPKCKNVEVLVSGQKAPCCPLGFLPPSGWPRFRALSTQALPVQRPDACLLGLLTGLAFPGDPSITPAKRMQRVMAPLKRQMSLRPESEGSCLQQAPCTLLPPSPRDSCPPSCPVLPSAGEMLSNSPSPRPARGVVIPANPSDPRK